jgi:SAM-dependent methyltransferase
MSTPSDRTSVGDQWRDELAAWAIPEEILATAPEPPWGFPVRLWRVGDEGGDESPSRSRALEVLPPHGSVLDVGCGGGRASLALVPAPGTIVGVDESADMLAAFAEAAAARGVAHAEVLGAWPDVADTVEAADVVVCHHVAYNVPDLGAFAVALTRRARRRVVLELTELHPLVATAPLWKHFHGLDRPTGPTADLACAVLREVGIEPGVERLTVESGQPDRSLLVAFTRRRLCLPARRDAEVDEALGPDWNTVRRTATLWWDS